MLKKVVLSGILILVFITISFLLILQIQKKEYTFIKEYNQNYIEILLTEINSKIEQKIEYEFEKLNILSNLLKNNLNKLPELISVVEKNDNNSFLLMISNEGNILASFPYKDGFNGFSILNFPDIADFFIDLTKKNKLAKYIKVKIYNNETLSFSIKNYICIGIKGNISNNNSFYLLKLSPLNSFFHTISDKFKDILGSQIVIYLENEPNLNNAFQAYPYNIYGLKYYLVLKELKPQINFYIKEHFTKINYSIFILLFVVFLFGAYIVYNLLSSHKKLEQIINKRVKEIDHERQKYEALFNNLPLPAIVFDPNTLEILETNFKAKEYGLDKNKNLSSIIKNKKILKDHIEALEKNIKDDFELNIDDKNYYHINSILDKDENKVITIMNDITEKRILQEKIKNSERKELIATITSGIAHDFKNTLNNLKIYFKLIENEPQNLNNYLKNIKSIVNSACDHINNLLLIAYNKKPSLKILNVDNLMKEFLQIIRQYLPKHIDITYINLTTNSKILGSKSTLTQAFMNIVINSKDAIGDKNGNITIIVDKESINDNMFVKVTFSDDGPGIDEEALKNIFKPFFTTKENGYGLGLTLVNRIIRELNGFMNIESAKGKGTIVKIYIPESFEK